MKKIFKTKKNTQIQHKYNRDLNEETKNKDVKGSNVHNNYNNKWWWWWWSSNQSIEAKSIKTRASYHHQFKTNAHTHTQRSNHIKSKAIIIPLYNPRFEKKERGGVERRKLYDDDHHHWW